ncbi:endo alpha-1,4 polygalactosaminidase [Mycobacterium barrassiae]|uniref:endo alpha-1,4 polygalactosaminidase n=1 Tax=Mycobacterium barrassiae TaxID=319709 RepID=UPI00226589C0|nr:endo alpha-1,4 polygalactosaminidase [Mycobacterium barrassiae]MCV7302962.1 endo alpha-1,4 polygalactosaminidase [Mycobacterium barrassiae]
MRIAPRVLYGAIALATLTACGGRDSGGESNTAASDEALWQPPVGTTWQWQLSGLPVDTSLDVAVYDVDLLTTTDDELVTLKVNGRKVICYFSAGSWEDFRPDASDFPDVAKGNPLDPPFQDELWLDTRNADVRTLMQRRLDLAVSRGCDAVEPDNVDGYGNDTGFELAAADQLDYNRFIAAEAHARGLSVGLKNDIDQLAELEPDFDWALNEECFTFDECALYRDNFLAVNKAVFHAEYLESNRLPEVCAVTKPLGLSTLIKNVDLDAFRLPCP